MSKEKKKQAAEDEKIRQAIEGKFGQGKRRFSLNRVMAKLSNTSSTAIAITFLVINLSTWLHRVFLCVFMPLRANNTCVEIENKVQLYLKQIKTEKLILNRARGYPSLLLLVDDQLFSKP